MNQLASSVCVCHLLRSFKNDNKYQLTHNHSNDSIIQETRETRLMYIIQITTCVELHVYSTTWVGSCHVDMVKIQKLER